MAQAPLTYDQASITTASMLRIAASTDMVRDLSRLSLPEVEAVVQAVSKVIPARNVPGVILNGLTHLPERQRPPAVVQRDLHLLCTGLELFMDKAVYGTVAPTSTLVRFIIAKDGNDKKTLAWGVITNAVGVMRISLRNFRPHVCRLVQTGQVERARRIAQDELDAFADGLNRYITGLNRIVLASRQTRTPHTRIGEKA